MNPHTHSLDMKGTYRSASVSKQSIKEKKSNIFCSTINIPFSTFSHPFRSLSVSMAGAKRLRNMIALYVFWESTYLIRGKENLNEAQMWLLQPPTQRSITCFLRRCSTSGDIYWRSFRLCFWVALAYSSGMLCNISYEAQQSICGRFSFSRYLSINCWRRP